MKLAIYTPLKYKFDKMYKCRYSDGTRIGYDAIGLYMELVMLAVGGNQKTPIQGTCKINVNEPYSFCKLNRDQLRLVLEQLEEHGLIKVTGDDCRKIVQILRIEDDVAPSVKIRKSDVE